MSLLFLSTFAAKDDSQTQCIMKKSFLLSLLLLLTLGVSAQGRLEFDVWPNGAPNDNGLLPENERGADRGSISGSCVAHLTVFPAARPNGLSVVICPGGGYTHLAMNHEGFNWADWFNAQGITCGVLKYRMPQGNYQVPLSDAQEAIRIFRRHADEWGISQVGIMGSSAGGHLAAMTSTHWSDEWVVPTGDGDGTPLPSCRPDFQILLYPVVSVDSAITHWGTRVGVVGKTPTDEQVRQFSNDRMVTPYTPQAFLMLSADDKVVVPENSIRYFDALNAYRVPVEMHIYPTGGHGWGFGDNFPYKPEWTAELSAWLRRLQNPGKKVSILGDSYSTYAGFQVPAHNLTWYYTQPRMGNDVSDVSQTWWFQYIQREGYRLERNASYSGSTICNTGYNGEDYTDRSFVNRIGDLGDPDIIFVFGGTNDSWAKVPMGKYLYKEKQWTKEALYGFRPATAKMLSDLKQCYPNAEIYFLLNSELSDDVNTSVETICAHYDVPLIRLHDIEKQAGHPSQKGMRAIADQIQAFIRQQ